MGAWGGGVVGVVGDKEGQLPTAAMTGGRCRAAVVYLARVGVIKSHKHLALVLLRKVLVQQGCFGMPYVQVTRGLWWESSDDLALLCVLKPYLKGTCLCTHRKQNFEKDKQNINRMRPIKRTNSLVPML